MATRITRRLRKQIRDQNWIGVGLDLAIVAVGVFLGIEAANWNESRNNRAEERRYYAQIIGDLKADLATLQVARDRSLRHDRAAEATLSAIEKGVPTDVPPGRVAVDAHYAGFLFVPRPVRRTYDEMISTGSLGLVRDQRAKNAIAAYYAGFDESRQWDDLLREQQSEYWQLTAGVVPRRVLQAAIRGEAPSLTRAEADGIIAEARRRPRVNDLLTGMAAHQERVRRDSEILANQARELIVMLEPLAD